MTFAHADRPLSVAVAIVVFGDLLLITRRSKDAHLGGLWEFPGGKIVPGETPEACALRETIEETGVRVRIERALQPINHEYADRLIRLYPFICRWVEGEAKPLGCDEVRWVRPQDLPHFEFPAANRAILAELLALDHTRPTTDGDS